MKKDTTEIQRRIELMVTNGLGYNSITELANMVINPRDCQDGLRLHLNDLALRDNLSLAEESQLVKEFRSFYERQDASRRQFKLDEFYHQTHNQHENYTYEYDETQTDGSTRRVMGIGCR